MDRLTQRQYFILILFSMVLFSSGTIMLLDSGLLNISGAATTATGTLSLTVTSLISCTLQNSSVTFLSVAPGTTVDTEADSTPTLVVNNSGNELVNVSVAANTSTVFFTSGTSPNSYKFKGGNLCAGNMGTGGTYTSAYTDTTGSHLSLVKGLNYQNGNQTCEIDFQLVVPTDEPPATLTDVIGINCTMGVEGASNTPILNSTDPTTNDTNQNLTLYFNAGTGNTSIYDWRINSSSIAVLNMPFDNQSTSFVKDYSTSSNDGTTSAATWRNSSVCGIASSAGGCYYFDGNDKIQVTAGSGSTLNFATNNFTATMWFNASSVSAVKYLIYKGLPGPSKPQWWIRFESTGKIRAVTSSLSAEHVAGPTASAYDDNTWHFLAFRRDETSLRIFIDGVSVASKTGSAVDVSAGSESYDLTIGSRNDDLSYLNGLMDQVILYNRSLSWAQINATYNSGIPRYNLTHSRETTTGNVWTVFVAESDNSTITTQTSNSLTVK